MMGEDSAGTKTGQAPNSRLSPPDSDQRRG
jgi:hypothetical protein